MWVITTSGTAVNLSKFCSIYFNEYSNFVVASLNDEAGTEYQIKEFNNEVDAKNYIAELVKKLNEEQAKKTVTYGDVLKATYGEHFTPQKSQSDGVSIEEAPVVVIARIKESADFLG